MGRAAHVSISEAKKKQHSSYENATEVGDGRDSEEWRPSPGEEGHRPLTTPHVWGSMSGRVNSSWSTTRLREMRRDCRSGKENKSRTEDNRLSQKGLETTTQKAKNRAAQRLGTTGTRPRKGGRSEGREDGFAGTERKRGPADLSVVNTPQVESQPNEAEKQGCCTEVFLRVEEGLTSPIAGHADTRSRVSSALSRNLFK